MATIAQVEERVVAAVLSVPVADYTQNGIPAAWTETDTLDLASDASSVHHLRFLAVVTDTQTTDQLRGAPGGEEHVQSTLAVTFAYVCRQGQQPADRRKALDAAQAVAVAINDSCRLDWSPQFAGIREVAFLPESGLVLFEVSALVFHLLPV